MGQRKGKRQVWRTGLRRQSGSGRGLGGLLVPGPPPPGPGLPPLTRAPFQDKREDRPTVVLGLALGGVRVYQVVPPQRRGPAPEAGPGGRPSAVPQEAGPTPRLLYDFPWARIGKLAFLVGVHRSRQGGVSTPGARQVLALRDICGALGPPPTSTRGARARSLSQGGVSRWGLQACWLLCRQPARGVRLAKRSHGRCQGRGDGVWLTGGMQLLLAAP